MVRSRRVPYNTPDKVSVTSRLKNKFTSLSHQDASFQQEIDFCNTVVLLSSPHTEHALEILSCPFKCWATFPPLEQSTTLLLLSCNSINKRFPWKSPQRPSLPQCHMLDCWLVKKKHEQTRGLSFRLEQTAPQEVAVLKCRRFFWKPLVSLNIQQYLCAKEKKTRTRTQCYHTILSYTADA